MKNEQKNENHGKNSSNKVTLVVQERFIVMTYFVILNNISTALFKCKSSYDFLMDKFSFLHNLTKHSIESV